MKISFPLKYRLNLFAHPANGISSRPWFESLYKYGIHWTMLPKVLSISTIVILNQPIVLLERMIFRSRIKKVSIQNPVFILGHPRSGTTYLHYLMSRDSKFATPTTLQSMLPNTFLLTGWIFRPFFNWVMPKKRPMDDMNMGPDHPKEEEFALANLTSASFAKAFWFPNDIEEIFQDTVLFNSDAEIKRKWICQMKDFGKKICFAEGKNDLLFKSPYNTARISTILEAFPNARFIHVHRHPAEVYVSTKKLYSRILPMLSLQKTDGIVVDQFIRSSYPTIYKAYIDDKKTLDSNRLFEVSFESLIESPRETLKMIYEKFDWDNFDEASHEFDSFIRKHADHQKDILDDKEKVMDDLGPEWKRISEEFGYY